MFRGGHRIPTFPVSASVDRDPRQSQFIPHMESLFLSEVVWFALKAMLRMNIDTTKLVQEVWYMERLIESVVLTPLTHLPSFHIMYTNTKSGNVGQTLGLLNL